MTRFISMIELMRSQVEPYQRLAWFLYEAAEREHRLNLEALAATPGAFGLAWMRIAGDHSASTVAIALATASTLAWFNPATHMRPERTR